MSFLGTFRKKPRAGDLRLLHDLAVVQRVTDHEREPARKRLDRTLGPSFAGSLVASLTETAPPAHRRFIHPRASEHYKAA